MEENKGQILLYQTVDGESRIEVTLCNRSNGRIISTEQINDFTPYKECF